MTLITPNNFPFVTLLVLLLFATDALAAKAPELSYRQKKILYQAQKSLQVGDAKQCAAMITQQQQKTNPLPAPFYALLGTCYYQSQQYDLASQSFAQALAQQPEDADLSLNRATCLYQAGDYLQAGEQFSTTYRLRSGRDSELLYQAAVAFYQGKDFQRASQSLQRLLSEATEPHTSWMELLLSCQLALHKWDEAGEQLQHLLRERPAHEPYWRLLAQLNVQQEHYQQATTAMEVMFQLKPPTNEDLKNLAGLYNYLNLPLRAADLLRRAYGDRPTQQQVEELANLYQRGFDFRQALAVVELGLEQWEQSAALQNLRTRLFYEQGRYEELLIEEPKGSQLTAQQHLLQGYAAWQLGRWTQACSFFKQALSDAKCASQAHNALEVLDLLLQTAEEG